MSISDSDDPRPLYAQVRDQLIERIRSGAWKPGQLIPNEFEIAAEFGVSQGTARKAIEALASERLVLRRQGRGTFVVEHTPAHVLFRFFNIMDHAGSPITPDSTKVSAVVAQSTDEEQTRLALANSDEVIRISRVRTRDGKPFIAETIALPAKLFPGLIDLPLIPNTLYDLFQKSYGILMMRTDDRLTAVSADADAAAKLSVAPGAPLLRIDRTAFGLDERPIEWRTSLCHLENAHYIARTKLSHGSDGGR
jgi:GntR family transcriptional regulator